MYFGEYKLLFPALTKYHNEKNEGKRSNPVFEATANSGSCSRNFASVSRAWEAFLARRNIEARVVYPERRSSDEGADIVNFGNGDLAEEYALKWQFVFSFSIVKSLFLI